MEKSENIELVSLGEMENNDLVVVFTTYKHSFAVVWLSLMEEVRLLWSFLNLNIDNFQYNPCVRETDCARSI